MWLWVALLAIAAAPVGWIVSDAIERQNDFCNACHLPDEGGPLHVGQRRDFDARPPVNLAGLHAVRIRADQAGDDPARCIDCHGGVGFRGKLRVKWLAARDALVWLGGDFEEPDEVDRGEENRIMKFVVEGGVVADPSRVPNVLRPFAPIPRSVIRNADHVHVEFERRRGAWAIRP